MKKNRSFIVLLCLAFFIVTSCVSDDKKAEYRRVANSKSTQVILQELYSVSNGDVQAIARILRCTPSTVTRIMNGTTSATYSFEKSIRGVYVYYLQKDESFSKLRAEKDPGFKWYDTVRYWPTHGWLFIVISIILGIAVLFIVFLMIVGDIDEDDYKPLETIGSPLLLMYLLVLVCWIISLLCEPVNIPDAYTESINTAYELYNQL